MKSYENASIHTNKVVFYNRGNLICDGEKSSFFNMHSKRNVMRHFRSIIFISV